MLKFYLRCSLFLACFYFNAQALVLRDINLISGGAQDFAGDRVVLTLLFLENEGPAEFKVRARRVFGKNYELISDVILTKAKRDQDLDPVSVVKTVQPPGTRTGIVETFLDVPYELFATDVAGQQGRFKFGYEVSAYRMVQNRKVDIFTAATRMTEFDPLGPMDKPIPPQRPEGRVREISGFVFKRNLKTGELEKQSVAVNAPVPAPHLMLAAPPGAGPEVDPIIDGKLSLTKDLRREFPILFGTNRKINAKQAITSRYTNEIGDLTYGKCMVNIPVNVHQPGEIEFTHWWKWTESSDVFGINSALIFDRASFFTSVAQNDILVYIHGFNTSFQDAVLTAAQMSFDIKFPGKVAVFSWPSQAEGTPGAYLTDAETAEKTIPYLMQFLTDILSNDSTRGGKARKIHIVAHSMGNELLLPTLRRMELKNPQMTQNRFQNIILAAPDVGEGKFASIIPTVIRATRKAGPEEAKAVSFYYSTKDWALGFSDKINGQNRAGNYPMFVDGMDTINTDNVNSAIGHGYYHTSVPVLTDLYLLVNRMLPANFRQPPLMAPEELRGFEGFLHYTFKAGML